MMHYPQSKIKKQEKTEKKRFGHDDSVSRTIHVTLPQHSVLNKQKIEYISSFFEFVPPHTLKQRLLDIFLLHLTHEHSSLPENLHEIASDYYLLFKMLDKLEEG